MYTTLKILSSCLKKNFSQFSYLKDCLFPTKEIRVSQMDFLL